MIFVDTCFLLAVLNPRDALHSRAQAWAETITEPLLITEYVVWELVNGLSMPVDRPKAYSAVQEINDPAASCGEWTRRDSQKICKLLGEFALCRRSI